MTSWPLKRSATSGSKGPENVPAATVVSTVGRRKVFAAFASATVALMMSSRSPLPTLKNICGWWSTRSSTALSGVNRFGSGAGVPLAVSAMRTSVRR